MVIRSDEIRSGCHTVDWPGSRWLIGGPARCGKSALAGLLARQNGPLATMRVDALLHRYKDTKTFLSDGDASEFLRTYLQRPRFMDAQKEKTQCPLDDFPDDLEQVVTDVAPQAGMSGLAILSAAFDMMARSRNKQGWAVLDLHPEIFYRDYANQIPDLKLLICLRDPLEAVTASLFWRSFPARPERFTHQLRYVSALWRLAASTALSLKQEFPDQVFTVSSNDIFEGTASLPGELYIAPDAFSRPFKGPAFFSARKSGDKLEFYCPDKRWHQLLESDEVAAMGSWRSRWWSSELINAQGVNALTPGGLLSGMVGRYPSLCKATLDMTYSPIALLRSRASKLKNALRKSS